ncbi:GTPase family protein [Photobacterium kishitanii]|uniref:GTPase family protein n=1 Tax=Photobacterium kishitanii TaxID=318456 RepID=UPI0007F8B50C|nr:GTPase [Photobacterium kishitanii]OBU30179.1 GTP-binding protein [Photobacterium kishitanii]PSW46814.1 GTP-binding protein [Photobacterium kishitanii]
MTNEHYLDDIISSINHAEDINEAEKNQVLRNLAKLKQTKVNLLVTGATGCGKSSTINAMFNFDQAKVGQGVDPETMTIQKFEMNNVVVFDSPGLGDGLEADKRHSENIINKLYEKDDNGEMLIDLVLVILDGSSRDLGTSFELINSVIIPNLGDDNSRLLVAINQADMAMKGRHWEYEKNQPDTTLMEFLDEKVLSTSRRIKEATGVDVVPIYYSAGYKEANEIQQPYNLSKLLAFILRHTKPEKRAVIAQDINKETNFTYSDGLGEYVEEIRESLLDSLIRSVGQVGEKVVEKVVTVASKVLDTGWKVLKSVGGSIARFFGF